MLLLLNQSKADSDSFSGVWQRLVKLLQVTAIVLLSAKLCRSKFFSHKSRSLRNILNKIGPSIEPCDTPDIIISKRLEILLIHTFCLRSFK